MITILCSGVILEMPSIMAFEKVVLPLPVPPTTKIFWRSLIALIKTSFCFGVRILDST